MLLNSYTCWHNKVKLNSWFNIALDQVGHNPAPVAFVPSSGWLGDNMIEASTNLTWYNVGFYVDDIDIEFWHSAYATSSPS